MINEAGSKNENYKNLILIGEDDMDDKEIIEEAFADIDPSVKVQLFSAISLFESSSESFEQEETRSKTGNK